MSFIKENLLDIEERINNALNEVHRIRDEVSLIAVSKTFPANFIIEAHHLGQVDFAENKVQEGEEKSVFLEGLKIKYHLIGHLQSNKVNKAIHIFDTIHSVDSLELASKINASCLREGKVMPIFLQINTSQEEQKSGIVCDKIFIKDIVQQIQSFAGVNLQGFMTMGPLSIKEKETRFCFSQLRELKDWVNQSRGEKISQLSMGMSHDFEWAIKEGSTMLRIGSAIFGRREGKESLSF